LDDSYLGNYATAVVDPAGVASSAAQDWIARFTEVGGHVLSENIHETFATPAGLDVPKNFDGLVRDVQLGAAHVVAVLRSAESGSKSQSVKFESAKTDHLYTPLDDTDEPTRKAYARLAPGGAAIFTTLPYEVTRVVAEVPPKVTAGQRLDVLATVKTRGALPGLHLLHVRIVDPNGRTLKLYGRTLIARDGIGGTYIPLAYNETPGIYRVMVRDVLTGVEATADVEIV